MLTTETQMGFIVTGLCPEILIYDKELMGLLYD